MIKSLFKSKTHTYQVIRKIDSGVSFDAFVANKVDQHCPEFNQECEVAIKIAKHQNDF